MRHVFQTRAFIAITLMLLLGAVRCINACQFPDEPVKKCHHDPAKPTGKICGQLSITTAGDDAPAIAITDVEPVIVTVAIARRLAPAILAPHGPPHVPLRI